MNSLNEYERQVEVEYRGEAYLVRDNGSVFRRSRVEGRRRQLDEIWTFGRPSGSTGYMQLGEHVVHRIVAFAFHERTSTQLVVDHIDTNRQNNRADNLRWVTRLENVLLNPITRMRVIRAYGSLEAFFRNPAALGDREQDLSWMRTVSKAEAEASRERLLAWAEAGPVPSGGRLAGWVFGDRIPDTGVSAASPDNPSLTPLATQRNWKTPVAFPACPESLGTDPIREYKARLEQGTIFHSGRFGEAVTEAVAEHDGVIGVVCRMPQPAVKGWAFATIALEDGKFLHESRGTYFTQQGAMNAFNELLEIDAERVETIDDLC